MVEYEEGYAAYGEDIYPEECPYPHGSDSYVLWNQGWDKAYYEYEGTRGVPSGGGEIEGLIVGMTVLYLIMVIIGVCLCLEN